MTCVLLILSGLSGTMTTAYAQTRAYVTNNSDHTVSVIDTATNTVITNIPIDGFPLEVAITPDSTRVYVTNAAVFDTGSVSVIDNVSRFELPRGTCHRPRRFTLTRTPRRATKYGALPPTKRERSSLAGNLSSYVRNHFPEYAKRYSGAGVIGVP